MHLELVRTEERLRQCADIVGCALLMRLPAFDHVVTEAPVMFSAGFEDKCHAVRFRMLIDETRQHLARVSHTTLYSDQLLE